MKNINDCQSVLELLSDPCRWTKGASFRDADGRALCMSEKDQAHSFCLNGAINFIYEKEERGGKRKILEDIAIRRTGFSSLANFNDSRDTTYERMMTVLTLAGI